MRLTQKNVNVAKLINLKNALNDCDISAELTNSHGIISLDATLFNSVNGNEEPFTVYIEDDEINHCIEPQTDRQKIVDEIANWLLL